MEKEKQAFFCPSCKVRLGSVDVRQAERDEVCLYVCRVCDAVVEEEEDALIGVIGWQTRGGDRIILFRANYHKCFAVREIDPEIANSCEGSEL